MRIDAIDIYWVRLPLAFVWRTSYADQRDTDTILVRMESGGQYAWGESCPPWIPAYSAEHTLATFHTLREHMVPRVVGQDLESSRDLLERIAFIKGNQFARAALDIGWWVLHAKRQGVPLHRALGGQGDRVAVGADFGVQDSLDILMEKIQGAIDQGFPRIKLKFRPGWDLHMIEAVRSTFPHFTFHIDCNAAYTSADTDLFRALDRFRLAMIEQPLADDGMSLINHADLQKRIETPVCLDESAHSLEHVQAAIRLGSCKVVNIKMARVGGLTASRDMQALCAEHGIPCWVGGMLESGIGGAICAELATLPNFTYPGDIFPSAYFYQNDIGKPEIVLSGRGEVATSDVPGIAQEPDADLLKRWTVEHASFRAPKD
ncbi:MAG TPA: o-succinylbenzoate synthase [Candidatus Methylomirabilis sp.]|nr:o-succinylbenzoate synthase [Candidatus Methylomirabilis sp.]